MDKEIAKILQELGKRIHLTTDDTNFCDTGMKKLEPRFEEFLDDETWLLFPKELRIMAIYGILSDLREL